MKNIIKKINVLAIGAMIVGGGFAFATINDDLPNVYLHPQEGWLPLNGMEEGVHYHCEDSSTNCTAYLDPNNPQAEPEIIVKGTFKLGI